MYRACLKEKEESSGLEDLETLRIASLLANLLNKSGKVDEAEELCNRSIEGFEKVVGPHHADTLRAINNRAIMLQRQGKVHLQA